MREHRSAKNDWNFLRNIVLKALSLFVLLNLLFAAVPVEKIGKISLYNNFLPGRERFPFGEDSRSSFNLSLYNLNAMFASHVAAAAPNEDEFRVFLLGDSSVWGTLLRPEETLAGQINAAELKTCDGRFVRAYNLGYPTLSLFKDLMILERLLDYDPDLILWLVTLESFPLENQFSSPIVANNYKQSVDLLDQFGLALDTYDFKPAEQRFWERTIIGQRRALADLARLQFYGVMWAATGIDQVYPENYTAAQRDFEADDTYHGWLPEEQIQDRMADEILKAGVKAARDVPIVFFNEPILISDGENKEIRYNYYYPRWAYDAYRAVLSEIMDDNDWHYFDMWNIIPQEEFTNSAIHLNPSGSQKLADSIITQIEDQLCGE